MESKVMTKTEFERSISQSTGFSLKDSKKLVNAFVEQVHKNFIEGKSTKIIGFGTFKVRQVKGRICRNPRNGEKKEVSAKKWLSFKRSSCMSVDVK